MHHPPRIGEPDVGAVPSDRAIRDYAYVLDQDPHVKARNMIGHFDHPVEGTIPVLASPIKLYATPATIRTAPPLLGQHTEEILGQLSTSTAP